MFYAFNFLLPNDLCINAIITNVYPDNYCIVYDKYGKV